MVKWGEVWCVVLILEERRHPWSAWGCSPTPRARLWPQTQRIWASGRLCPLGQLPLTSLCPRGSFLAQCFTRYGHTLPIQPFSFLEPCFTSGLGWQKGGGAGSSDLCQLRNWAAYIGSLTHTRVKRYEVLRKYFPLSSGNSTGRTWMVSKLNFMVLSWIIELLEIIWVIELLNHSKWMHESKVQ